MKIAAVNTCIRATHSKMAMSDVLYVTKETTPESVSRNNQTAWFDLSHIPMTGHNRNNIIFLSRKGQKNHNHHIRTHKMY